MNPVVIGARSGLKRGLIELRNLLTNYQDLFSILFPNAILFVVLLFMRNAQVPGLNFSLGATVLPSLMGMSVAFGGMISVAQYMVVEREDGTLLRAKAVPNGMMGYLVGKIVFASGLAIVGILVLLVPGLFLFPQIAATDFGGWLTLVLVVVIGLVATMPLGAIIGSLFSSAQSMGLIMLPIMGLVGISGIFYPISQLPAWLQWIGQIFPIYWTGLGMRSALLPDQLAAVEIGQSWRPVEMYGILLAWAVAGLVVAPFVLRRMARRESGSSVAARREKAMQRIS